MSRMVSDPSRSYSPLLYQMDAQGGLIRQPDVVVWMRRVSPSTGALERAQVDTITADRMGSQAAPWRRETPYDSQDTQ